MLSGEIRERFLKFFEKRGHKIAPSDLLVPREDNTLLFTGAGMNQFKEEFMGRNITYTRAASCQKCLRTGDLENVGKTPRHHTFFEMLGNFSFGDYFKKDAIKWAWDFMTGEIGFPEAKLWVSVHKDDKESYEIWLKDIKIPKERIVKLGDHDNFWPADAPSKGPNGPCGPCSEIFYDWGKDVGCGRKSCDPSCDCERFVELWNLVFTQFERRGDGSLSPLPKKNIDTGMGLERMASVLQNVKTNFDSDLFTPIIDNLKFNLGGKARNISGEDLCLMADHIRAVVFAVCDGVSPSNERQGYVVRKLIRRAFLRSGSKNPFLYKTVFTISKLMGGVYPELMEKSEHIAAIVNEEEKRFSDTLISAIPVYEDMVRSSGKLLKGEDIFKLVDTYGLPLDVIKDESVKRNISLDMKSFENLMENRKSASRLGSNITTDFIFKPDIFENAPMPALSDKMPIESAITFIVKDGKANDLLGEGERGEILASPQSSDLYSEGGGQVGDKGFINKGNDVMEIINTYDVGGRKVMEVEVKNGKFRKGDRVVINIDHAKKAMTALNHTATHLLQAALRDVLGYHVKQSGSLVDHTRLRFDFTHMKKLSDMEIQKAEELMNGWVEKRMEVTKKIKTMEEARLEGALSFFGDKYGDTVRVVTVADVSKELCGGTHIDNTGQIKLVKIISESSVASGIRRVEAITGITAINWIKEKAKEALGEYKSFISCFGEDILKRELPDMKRAVSFADNIFGKKESIKWEDIKNYEDIILPFQMKLREYRQKHEKDAKKRQSSDVFESIKARINQDIDSPELLDGGVKFISDIFEDIYVEVLRKASSYAEKRAGSRSVIFFACTNDDKVYLASSITSDLEDTAIKANEIISLSAKFIQGSGGGTALFAQAGGKDPLGIKDALAKAREMVSLAAKLEKKS